MRIAFDFSTLYTNIPHDSLKTNMKELIDEAFSARGAQYIPCNSIVRVMRESMILM